MEQTIEVRKQSIYRKEKYEIYVDLAKVPEVMGWAERGLSVRGSLALENAGTYCYQPLVDGQPQGHSHWQFPPVPDDIVRPEEWRDRIKVVAREFVWDAFVPCECQYCGGSGMRANPWPDAQWHEDIPDMQYSTKGMNKWRARALFCQEVVVCWVCGGTGIGKEYLTGMDRKRKTDAKDELEGKGWTLRWRKGPSDYRGWEMERLMVVKEWGKESAK